MPAKIHIENQSKASRLEKILGSQERFAVELYYQTLWQIYVVNGGKKPLHDY